MPTTLYAQDLWNKITKIKTSLFRLVKYLPKVFLYLVKIVQREMKIIIALIFDLACFSMKSGMKGYKFKNSNKIYWW